MTDSDPFLQHIAQLQRSTHDQLWAHLCSRMITEYDLRLRPESYRDVAQHLEAEVLPTVPDALQRDTRELIRSLIQDAQYFSWLRDMFGAQWQSWRNQGHPQLGDLRQRFERDRQLERSPYAYGYWPGQTRAPRPEETGA
jgi:hypothetical protein